MAYYTTTIRTIIESGFDLGLKDYPIFEEDHRNILNEKIIKHFYFREIGQETPALFRFMLNEKMAEIMPKYNILYKAQSEYLKTALLSNVNISETETTKNNKEVANSGKDTTTTATTDTSSIRQLFQDTPQGQISNAEIENQTWATNATMQKGVTENENNVVLNRGTKTNEDSTFERMKTTIGNSGGKYAVEVLNEVSKAIFNIDEMIINELNDLFIGLY